MCLWLIPQSRDPKYPKRLVFSLAVVSASAAKICQIAGGTLWKKDGIAGYFWLAVRFWPAYICTLSWSARRLTWTVWIKEHLIGIALLLRCWVSETRVRVCKPQWEPLLSWLCQPSHPRDLTVPHPALLVPKATMSSSGYRSLLIQFWSWLTCTLLRVPFRQLSWHLLNLGHFFWCLLHCESKGILGA